MSDAARASFSFVRAFLLLVVVIGCIGAATGVAGQSAVWRVSDRPVISIGDETSEGAELFWVRDATVLADGRIAIINGGTRDIRIYDEAGNLAEVLGREGEGPGEYLIPKLFREVRPGVLLVSDLGNQRLTWVRTDGEVFATRHTAYPLGVSGIPEPHHRPLSDGLLPIATTRRSLWNLVNVPEGMVADTVTINVHDGTRLIPIAHRPSGSQYTVRMGNRGLSKPIPFGEVLLRSSGRESVVLGSSHDTVFQAISPKGDLMGEYRVKGRLRRVTRRDWDDYQSWFRTRNENAFNIRGTTISSSLSVERFLDRTPRGEVFPLFDRILVDDQDRLWVREYTVTGRTRHWQVATLARGTIARIELPIEWFVLEFAERSVLILERGDLDVERVRLYEIRSQGTPMDHPNLVLVEAG